MSCSAIFHLYMPLGQNLEKKLLSLDLVGIGVMIFGLAMTASYLGFHNWHTERIVILCSLGVLFVFNIVMVICPCCYQGGGHYVRVAVYFMTIALTVFLSISGRFIYGTKIEVDGYYG